MDKETLEKRIAELKQMLNQVEANGNALVGAIQECEYWLAAIAKSKQTGKGEPSPERNENHAYPIPKKHRTK